MAARAGQSKDDLGGAGLLRVPDCSGVVVWGTKTERHTRVHAYVARGIYTAGDRLLRHSERLHTQ